MKDQMKIQRPSRAMGPRQRIFILLLGTFWVMIGTVYFGLLTGWSAGMTPHVVSPPSVLVKASRAWFLVDGQGIVRGAMSHDRLPTLPQLHGIDSGALLRQEFSEVDAARKGSELATMLSESGADHAPDLQLNFSDPHDVVASLNGTTIHYGSSGFREKWDRVMYIRGAQSMSLLSEQEFDLRFPNAVIVREQK